MSGQKLPEVWQADDGTVAIQEPKLYNAAGDDLFKIIHIGPFATEMNMWRGQFITREFLADLVNNFRLMTRS